MLHSIKSLSSVSIVFILCFCLVSSAWGDDDSSPAHTDNPGDNPGVLMDQAREAVAEKHYEQALVPLKKCMGLHDHDADAINRHEVLMLVAECDLQTQHVADSMKILDLAVKEAKDGKAWPDEAEAFSLVSLLHEAPKLYYSPKIGEDRKTLDLRDLSQRKTAYEKLQQEALEFCEDEGRGGRELASLKPLLDNGDAFALSRALEQTLTGKTTESDKLGDKLAVWSDGMITATLKSYTPRINEIVIDSNVTMKGRRVRGQPAGLSRDQREELQGIDAICVKVPDAITQLTDEYARPIMTHAERNITAAKNIATRVEAILLTDSKILKNRKPS